MPVTTHLLKLSVRHPRLVLALVCAVTCCALVFVPRIRVRLDGLSLIPAGLPEFADVDAAAARFGLRDLLVVGVGNEESGVYTPETGARVMRLSEGLARVEGVVDGSVRSLATLPRITRGVGPDAPPLVGDAGELSDESVRLLRREAAKAGYNNGTLASADGKAAAVVAQVEPGADRYRLLEEARALVARESAGGDAVYLSGSALAQAALGQATAAAPPNSPPTRFGVEGTEETPNARGRGSSPSVPRVSLPRHPRRELWRQITRSPSSAAPTT